MNVQRRQPSSFHIHRPQGINLAPDARPPAQVLSLVRTTRLQVSMVVQDLGLGQARKVQVRRQV